MKKVAAILTLVMLGSGCAATTESPDASSSEEALSTLTALDRVTPADVASTFAASMRADLGQAMAHNPSITEVNASNLDRFYQLGPTTWSFDLREAIEGLLATTASIPVRDLGARFEPWAKERLASHVDANGFYVAPKEGDLLFYSYEIAAREDKANSLAAKPGGQDLAAIREQWRAVQRERGNLDSAYLRPVKVLGEPTLAQIERTFHIPYEAKLVAWGNEAVASFGAAHEGPDGAPSFAPLASFLESHAIQKRWLFQAYDSSWSTNVLVVLDDQGQLWGFQMGYSK
ncbi:MAG: hypothetical protein U0270_23355 [Labilithrix sp.]